jgi:hypothetical protein
MLVNIDATPRHPPVHRTIIEPPNPTKLKVTFITHLGVRHEVPAVPGQSLMLAAVTNGVPDRKSLSALQDVSL